MYVRNIHRQFEQPSRPQSYHLGWGGPVGLAAGKDGANQAADGVAAAGNGDRQPGGDGKGGREPAYHRLHSVLRCFPRGRKGSS